MNDDLIKRLDKLGLLIKRLEQQQPELEKSIDSLRREQAETRREIERVERQINGVRAIPADWRVLATHELPMLMM